MTLPARRSAPGAQVEPRYTTLKVTEAGVVLLEEHAARLAPHGGPALRAYLSWASSAGPGVYRLWWEAGELTAEQRPASGLCDGMPVRTLVSPVAHERGPLPKPPPPGPYSTVRQAGVATLLTSACGTELLESCSASLLGWDGRNLLVVPDDRPRVASTAEAAVRAELPVRRVPLRVDGDCSLLLLNAVKGPCRIELPGRPSFPGQLYRRLQALLDARTGLP